MNQQGFDDGPQGPEIRLPKPNFKLIRNVAILVLALIIGLSAFYTVEPEETALVLRFGRYIRSSEPGLHLKLPFGIESVEKVQVQRQKKEEFGFRTVKAGVRSQYATRQYASEANMLSGDLNAAVVEWIVQYRISDPYQFLFRVRNVQETFRDMTEATMREIVGDRTVNEVLTVGRQQIEAVSEELVAVVPE